MESEKPITGEEQSEHDGNVTVELKSESTQANTSEEPLNVESSVSESQTNGQQDTNVVAESSENS